MTEPNLAADELAVIDLAIAAIDGDVAQLGPLVQRAGYLSTIAGLLKLVTITGVAAYGSTDNLKAALRRIAVAVQVDDAGRPP